MKNCNKKDNSNNKNTSATKPTSNGFIPNSFKFISSCIRTASSGVRSASASVAASISGDSQDNKDQVLCASFGKLELGSSSFKNVLLIGYSNGFQVLDVDDASNINELVSKRDDPVSFLQMQPLPAKSDGSEEYRASHPLLLVVACDKSKIPGTKQIGRDSFTDPQSENLIVSPTAVRFYSLKSHGYVHALRFRSPVYMVRCSPHIVAVGLAAQIYCFDALTLESKFSVLTYPVPQLGGHGMVGVNVGYGPMSVGPRWLAYASNNPMSLNTGRLSPQSITPPSVSPSTSPSSGNLVARYAMESSKHIAAGLINLGDMGYRTLSKYCQDLIPDGSNSPVSSTSSWKVSRFGGNPSDGEAAGVVVVKDFASRAIVSQFRAHTSPISALCFDPSGTLLVTASIYGNNINVFRIMPSCSRNGPISQSHDWSSSHVHLYKLHRGMTSAVIHDICFSQYSQWVAIISSKSTCHIFVLAPFGGETVLQIQNPDVERPVLMPVLSVPWWCPPYLTVHQQHLSLPPPSPVTLSVISRIKNCNSGWLGTVSNAASPAAGKISIPTGAVSAVFHNSFPLDSHIAPVKKYHLEYLLVYTPSGHLVQYMLLPSVGGDCNEHTLRGGAVPAAQIEDEDLRVKVEPVHGWDVCRRNDWPEREELLSLACSSRKDAAVMTRDSSHSEETGCQSNELVKPHERSQAHFSKAEVQINSSKIALWHKSQLSFYVINPLDGNNLMNIGDDSGGEFEIESVPVQEVEIRRKDLLPVFNHFSSLQSNWVNRGLASGRCSNSSSHSHATENMFPEDFIPNSKLIVPGSVKADNVSETRGGFIRESPKLKPNAVNEDCVSVGSRTLKMNGSSVENGGFLCSPLPSTNASHFAYRETTGDTKSYGNGPSEPLNMKSNHTGGSTAILEEQPIVDSTDFNHFFNEGYCEAPADKNESLEGVTHADCSSRPKSENDGDSDDFLGGVFDFSVEG